MIYRAGWKKYQTAEHILRFAIFSLIFGFNKILTLPLELVLMSPFVCSNSEPSSFTNGACFDSKHVLIQIISVASMVAIIRISFLCEKTYFSCNPFAEIPTGEISPRLRALVLFGHHFTPVLMTLNVHGNSKALVL